MLLLQSIFCDQQHKFILKLKNCIWKKQKHRDFYSLMFPGSSKCLLDGITFIKKISTSNITAVIEISSTDWQNKTQLYIPACSQ